MIMKDKTSYSRSDKERKPNILVFESESGIKFSYTVHKHIYYGDEWLLTCREVNIEQKPLKTENFEEAKKKAVDCLIGILATKILQYRTILEEINPEETNHD